MTSQELHFTTKALLTDLPKDFHDNEYIETGYRMHYRGSRQVLRSMCQCHNETFNIWSHFLGKVIAFIFALFVMMYYPNMEYVGSHGAFEGFKAQKSINGSLTIYQYVDSQSQTITKDIIESEKKLDQNQNGIGR